MKKMITIVCALLLTFSLPLQSAQAKELFTDVPVTHNNYEEIMYLLDHNVIVPSSKYGVSDIVTREEVAVMIAKAIGLDGTPVDTKFKDVPKSNANSGYIQSAVNAGIINGYENGTFRPKNTLTRGHMAAFIARAFDLPDGNGTFKDVGAGHTAYEAVRKLAAAGITTGYPDGTFRPNLHLTRGHISAFLARTMKYGAENDRYEVTINNFKLDTPKTEIEKKLGMSKRAPYPYLGLQIHTYYEDDYENLHIVGYDRNSRVALIYTNADTVKITKNDKLVPLFHKEIGNALGEPDVKYPNSRDIFKIGNQNVNFFYEKSSSSLPVRALSIQRTNYESKETALEERNTANSLLIFDVTNSYRKKMGLSPFQWSEEIAQVAYNHSMDMHVNQYFSHKNLKGESSIIRIIKSGTSLRPGGENIARDYGNGIEATEGWMNSTGHRSNILNDTFTHLGPGVYDLYYTQNFGRSK